MTDLVIDTNSLEILNNEDTLGFIIDNHDVVYAPRCVIRKECPSVYRLKPMLMLNIRRGIRKLKGAIPSCFYEINPTIALKSDLEGLLIKEGADDCDRDLVKLCKERKQKTSDVKIITTNERHFQKIHRLRSHCDMIGPEDYPAM